MCHFPLKIYRPPSPRPSISHQGLVLFVRLLERGLQPPPKKTDKIEAHARVSPADNADFLLLQQPSDLCLHLHIYTWPNIFCLAFCPLCRLLIYSTAPFLSFGSHCLFPCTNLHHPFCLFALPISISPTFCSSMVRTAYYSLPIFTSTPPPP